MCWNWILVTLIKKSQFITSEYAHELIYDCLSINKMLVSNLNTVKSNITKWYKICCTIAILLYKQILIYKYKNTK